MFRITSVVRSRTLLARHMSTAPKVDIVGVPLDLGTGRRGVDMGPSAIRLAGINGGISSLGIEVKDHGNISVVSKETLEDEGFDVNVKYHKTIGKSLSALKAKTCEIVKEGRFPVVIGGDHSMSIGSLSGLQKGLREAGSPRAGLLWVDAHTAINIPETSPSGNLHGMCVSSLIGHGNIPSITEMVGNDTFDRHRTAIVGVRSVDAAEKQILRDCGFVQGKNLFTMRDIDRLGMNAVVKLALAVVSPPELANDGAAAPFAMSVNLDSIDPAEAPGVGNPIDGGLTYRESHLAMELVAEHGGLVGMDIAEVNPILDENQKTANLAVMVTLSGLGKQRQEEL